MLDKMSKNRLLIYKIIEILLLSTLIIIISISFVSKKENLDYDEMSTYGLANNSFLLNVDENVEMTGGEALLKYASVQEGNEFNIKNVFDNQTKDTHPPIYYIIVNFICSINSGKFSIWYGLSINIFFIIILIFQMRYLINLIINDRLSATLISIISFFTYGFVNMFVFTRMYVMAGVISMSFIILIVNEMRLHTKNSTCVTGASDNVSNSINKDAFDKKQIIFLILFFLNCYIGTLTHYHFMIVSLIYSIIYGIYLLRNKCIKKLIATALTGILSLLCAYLTFPIILHHLFGKTKMHSVLSEKDDSKIDVFLGLLKTIKKSFFGNGIYIYIVFLVIGILCLVFAMLKNRRSSIDVNNLEHLKNKNQIKKQNNIKNSICDRATDSRYSLNKIYFIILISVVIFYVIIALTLKKPYDRYLYIVYPLIIIAIIIPIYKLYSLINQYLKYISIVLLLVVTIMSRLNEKPFSLNPGDAAFHSYLNENSNVKVLSIYNSVDNATKTLTRDATLYKAHRPLYILRDMESITFIDKAKNPNFNLVNEEKFKNADRMFLIIYPVDDDDGIISKVMIKYNFASVEKVYISNYFHMYILRK